jgi:hypothetical protein
MALTIAIQTVSLKVNINARMMAYLMKVRSSTISGTVSVHISTIISRTKRSHSVITWIHARIVSIE